MKNQKLKATNRTKNELFDDWMSKADYYFDNWAIESDYSINCSNLDYCIHTLGIAYGYKKAFIAGAKAIIKYMRANE